MTVLSGSITPQMSGSIRVPIDIGNITVNKGMNKFTLRGQEKVNGQWQMYCLVHNIEKLRNSLH